MSIPNVISLARLLAVPFMVHLILRQNYDWAFWLFVIAGISDAVDGAIAKHMNQRSKLGAYLDPLADKALLVGVYVTLGVKGEIADLIVILVVFRDILIVGGVLLQMMFRHNGTPEPAFVSKVNTAVQLLFAAIVLAELGLAVDSSWIRGAMAYAVALTTLVSGGWYLVAWGRNMASMEDPR